MAEVVANQAPEIQTSGSGGLKRGALGLIAAAGIGIVVMGPVGTPYGIYGAMDASSGKVVPFLMILTAFLMIPSVLSFAFLSRHMPSAGSGFTWLSRAAGNDVGAWLGWSLVAYYFINVVIQPTFWALFFNAFLSYIGVQTSFWTWAGALLLVTIPVMYVTLRSVRVTGIVTIIMMCFEATVLLAFTITVLWVQGTSGHLGFSAFNPATASGPSSNPLLAGVILAVFAYVGWDITATVAEETRVPKRLIPLAMVGGIIAVGVFWTVAAYAFVYSAPLASIKSFSSGITPYTSLAHTYWGAGEILIFITAFTAWFANYTASMTGTSRVVYAMGRDGRLPRWLGKVHPSRQVPTRALLTLFGLLVVVDIGVSAAVGIENSFVWLGTSLAFFALLIYGAVCVATTVWFYRYRRASANWFLHGFIPALGLAINVYLIIEGFILPSWSNGFALGQSIVIFSIAWCVIGIGYAFALRRWAPQSSRGETTILAEGE